MKALIAPAKINLRLKITGRRPESGYHDLSMINACASLADTLVVHEVRSGPVVFNEIKFGDLIHHESRLELDRVLRGPSNLISDAAAAFGAAFQVSAGLVLSLNKCIPAGAGLGGGSSNSAAVIKFLLDYYGHEISRQYNPPQIAERVRAIALSLGADVPFSLDGRPAIVSGIGDVISPMPDNLSKWLEGMELFIIVPESPSPTVGAYRGFADANPWLKDSTRQDSALEPLYNVESDKDFYALLGNLIENDFEQVVSDSIPEVRSIISLLKDLKIGKVSLSGSGSAILILPLPQGKFTWQERSTIKSVLTHNLIKHFDGFVNLV